MEKISIITDGTSKKTKVYDINNKDITEACAIYVTVQEATAEDGTPTPHLRLEIIVNQHIPDQF
jgi:hypothetical protein